MNDPNDAYTELAGRHGAGHSARYRRILEMLMTPLQARLVAMLPARVEALASRAGLEAEAVEEHLRLLFCKGVVVPERLSPLGGYRFCAHVEQLHDASLTSSLIGDEEAPAFFDLWNRFCHEEWYPHAARLHASLERPRERVIPAYRAIRGIPGVLPCEDVLEILKSNHPVAVVPCMCRRREKKCGKPLDVCFQFGASAEYAVLRGSGRELSYPEAVERMDLAEESGLVHGWVNSDTLTSHCMCNCCNDCCIAMVPLIEHHVPLGRRVSRSRFDAQVDPARCEGCGACLERCPFDAVEMKPAPGTESPKATVNLEKCFGCGVCVLGCEHGALSMVLARPPGHIPSAAPA